MVTRNQSARVRRALPYLVQALAFLGIGAVAAVGAVLQHRRIEAAGGLGLGESDLLGPPLEMGAAACGVGLLIALGIAVVTAFEGGTAPAQLQSETLPPIGPETSVDRTVLEVHRVREGGESMGGGDAMVRYLRRVLLIMLAIGGVSVGLAVLGLALPRLPAWHQIQSWQDRDWRTGQSLAVGLPVMLFGVPLTLFCLRMVTHGRVEIHPDGVTVRGVFVRHTFENSSATLILDHMSYLGDRRTGRRMSLSHLYAGAAHRAVRRTLNRAVVVDEMTHETVRFLPWYEKNPVLGVAPLIACFLWLVMLGVNALS